MSKIIKNKAFTIVELIVVILVLGLLTGLALPKLINLKRDTDIATLYKDIDSLETAIVLYNTHKDSLPIGDKITPSEELLKTVTSVGDSGNELYKIDISKSKEYHTRLKHGKNRGEDDFFVYSKDSSRVFYAKGLEDADGELIFGYMGDIRNVAIGETYLSTNSVNKVEITSVIMTGEVPINEEITVTINDSPVYVTYENISFDYDIKNIYAAETKYKRFKADINLSNNKINDIKIKTKSKVQIYKVVVDNNNPEVVVPDGIVGKFTFEGNQIVNEINSKTYIGSGIDFVPGKVGSGIQINGGQIKIPNADLDINSSTEYVTVSYIMKWNGELSAMPIGFNRYDNYIYVGEFGFNTHNSDVYGINNPLSTSEYKHVVIIFKKGNYRLNSIYIDGIKQNLSQKRGSMTASRASFGDAFHISGWGYSGDYRLSGSIMDEVYIWNRALTDVEVESLYNSLK
ncbi:LamG-like jellyroll fold domain-containing protein [Alkaliphilus sp. B6464]|uniref:LamG-like jellyroll fold domain-containing protein n=1 Tax=Alkaliphilus sp. B6464 TaxID=2731219 RepID=UPI001BAC0311|nr:LamG-like jellyroll fold domain-containing protein [Alkaliphilus sp. B6464]QUH22148.1 prepilin-type N-terminal cleavage/methylation domain-containing protein [Alkaliphilus sp. B6464]